MLYDHLLDPETRKRIDLQQEEQIELEKLNKRILSEEQAKRWAEIIRENTEYGEKVLLFAVSQAHALMLVKELNTAFNDKGESPPYAEAIISENDEVNEPLLERFVDVVVLRNDRRFHGAKRSHGKANPRGRAACTRRVRARWVGSPRQR